MVLSAWRRGGGKLAAVVSAIALAGVIGPAPAQDASSGIVRCSSRQLQWTHCDMPTAQGVELVRQRSEASCIRNSDWGVDNSGVWVSGGCAADFRPLGTQPSSSSRDEAPQGPVRRVVRCASKGRPESCPVLLRGAPVRLLRQTSVMPCREGQTWEVKRNEIRVSRGCGGEFELAAEDGSGFVDVPRRITCASKRKLRIFCGASIAHEAELARQVSSTPCVQGETWGWTPQGIWTNNGCRGEFLVR